MRSHPCGVAHTCNTSMSMRWRDREWRGVSPCLLGCDVAAGRPLATDYSTLSSHHCPCASPHQTLLLCHPSPAAASLVSPVVVTHRMRCRGRASSAPRSAPALRSASRRRRTPPPTGCRRMAAPAWGQRRCASAASACWSCWGVTWGEGAARGCGVQQGCVCVMCVMCVQQGGGGVCDVCDVCAAGWGCGVCAAGGSVMCDV
jgi:hypothetical protein